MFGYFADSFVYVLSNQFLHNLFMNSIQAILKIVKHCKEFSPALVTGQLLGLDVGSVLEITNCFPFPVCEFHGISFPVNIFVTWNLMVLDKVWCIVGKFYSCNYGNSHILL